MISALMDPDSLVKRNRTAGFFDLNFSGQTWTTTENAAMGAWPDHNNGTCAVTHSERATGVPSTNTALGLANTGTVSADG